MAHPAAPPLLLRVGDHEELTRLVRASSVRAGMAQRARIVLLASEGLRNAEIADRVGVSRPTVNVWRSVCWTKSRRIGTLGKAPSQSAFSRTMIDHERR
jgi:DNA-directed RNA polymerase specialized sigma24 family protein